MSQHTQVCIIGDRHVIQTDARRAEAILLTLSGMPMAEVGRQFGVSRERIRQYLKDAGLTGKDRKIIRDPSQQAIRWMGSPERQRQHRTRLKQRSRQRVLRAIRVVEELARTHQRTPTHLELARTLAVPNASLEDAAMRLISYFKRHLEPSTHRAARRLRFIYRAAGFPDPRPRGTNAHRDGGAASQRGRIAGLKRWWANLSSEQKGQRLAALNAGRVRQLERQKASSV